MRRLFSGAVRPAAMTIEFTPQETKGKDCSSKGMVSTLAIALRGRGEPFACAECARMQVRVCGRVRSACNCVCAGACVEHATACVRVRALSMQLRVCGCVR